MFEKIYSINGAFSRIREGKTVFVLDKKECEVYILNNCTIEAALQIENETDTTRFEIWIEKEAENGNNQIQGNQAKA